MLGGCPAEVEVVPLEKIDPRLHPRAKQCAAGYANGARQRAGAVEQAMKYTAITNTRWRRRSRSSSHRVGTPSHRLVAVPQSRAGEDSPQPGEQRAGERSPAERKWVSPQYQTARSPRPHRSDRKRVRHANLAGVGPLVAKHPHHRVEARYNLGGDH